MSLRVWLPLTKDLRNQGLSDIIMNNHNATFDNNGKLGGCYYFNGNGQWIQFNSNLGSFYTGDWSLAVWLKPTDSTRGIILSEYSGTGASNIAVELLATRVVRVYWNGSPDINFNTAGAIPINTWTHLTVTRTGRIIKVYFNGELKETYTHSSDLSNRTSACQPRIGDDYRGGSSVSYQGYMNDFRLYDHYLSPMEVKQISQGLILHYPLNRQGWGQENLITKYDTSFLSYPDGAVTLFSNQMNNGAQEIVSNINGVSKCLHLHSNGGRGRQYTTLGVDSGQIYTISVDYYSTNAQSAAWSAELNGGDYNWTVMSGANYTTPGKWQRLSYTIGPLTSEALLYYFVYCKNGDDCYIRNVKIEKGSIATPWSPAPSDELADTMGLNSNIEYDTSGFNNNGTRTGTFSWTSDTPKYEVSTKITPNSNIQFTPMLTGAYSWTIAAWIKPAVANNNGKVWFSVEQNTYWQITCYSNQLGIRDNSIGGTGTRKNYSFGTIAANTWVHLVATYDNGTLKLYNNGVLQNTNTVGGTYLNAMNNGRWGSAVEDGYYWNGQISDARIYATALSASDVLSLYQNSAYIDSNGNVYGAVHSEV